MLKGQGELILFKLVALLTIAVLFDAGAALAADLEKPPIVQASKILGSTVKGPGYSVVSPVRSDGYLRLYTLKTPWGTFKVSGDQMLKLRIKELAALKAMQQTTDSQQFADALANAGLRPVEFAGKLVTEPVDTLKDTVSGVGQLFGGIASGIRNRGKTQENAVASITGAAKQRRIIAYKYGIDPYTDFAPLKDKLDKLAGAAAAGGLAVTGAFMVIPGAAGTVISNVSTAGTLNEMVRDKSASQLMDINRNKLAKVGIGGDLAEELLTNRYYTPVDITAMAEALVQMGELRQLDVMVARAVEANSRDVAYFMRRRIELTAEYQQKTGQLRGFSDFGSSPIPMSTTADNGIIGIFPLDILSWTKNTSNAVMTLTTAAREYGITGPLVLRITGTVTPLARTNLTSLGWVIEENAGN
jgi:hypothetical protein